MTDRLEVLLKLYDENASHAKLHEEQREKMTNYIFLVSGILVTFITTSRFAYYTRPASLVLVAVGLYGWLFSLKHYERTRHHVAVMKEFRDEIEAELNPTEAGSAKRTLKQIAQAGRNKHESEFHLRRSERDRAESESPSRGRIARFILRSHLYRYWAAMPLVLVVLGLIFVLLPLTGIGTEAPEKPILVRLLDPSP